MPEVTTYAAAKVDPFILLHRITGLEGLDDEVLLHITSISAVRKYIDGSCAIVTVNGDVLKPVETWSDLVYLLTGLMPTTQPAA